MPDIFAAHDTPETTPEPTGTHPVENHVSTTKPQSKESHIHALASYCVSPSTIFYQGRDISSSVELFIRRHVVTNVPWILTTILLLFVPPLLRILLIFSPEASLLPSSFVMVFFLFYYLIVAMYAFISFLNWFYNIIIITTTEIIDIDYADVVYHDVAATNVNLIEDVQYVQSGFIQGLFNYGSVFVQTAGGHENIEALSIPNPAEIARFILSYIGKGELGG